MTTPELIQKLSIEQINFDNEATEAIVEELLTANTKMYQSASAFEVAGNAAGIAPLQLEKTSGAIVGLAGSFGKFYEELTPDEVSEVNDAFGEIYKGETGELDAAGSEMFNDVILFIAKAKAVNKYFNTPPVEE